MKKKTAVEWLLENITISSVAQYKGLNIDSVIEQAKQMEKEQIMNSFVDGGYVDTNLERQSSEQYFEELYGK